MARKARSLTTRDLAIIGKKHGSEAVAREGGEAAARWRRDLTVLAEYGHGPAALAAFEALLAEHRALMEARPKAIAAKRSTVDERDAATARAWDWLDKVESMLAPLVREDEDLAHKLNAAMPADDAELESKIGAVHNLLAETKGRFEDPAIAEKRIGEVDALQAGLSAAPGNLRNAHSATVVETAELDLLDGRIYVTVRDLNAAARKATRNGELHGGPSEYRFRHLNRSGRPRGSAEEPATVAPEARG